MMSTGNKPEDLDPNFAVSVPDSDLLWYDARKLTVAGLGWTGEERSRTFDRFPKRAEAIVPSPVWSLSRHSAGIEIQFQSDAAEIGARWTVLNPGLAMDHMPATGVSGLDLYALHDSGWRWLAVGRPVKSPANQVKLIGGMTPGIVRGYRLYLPLYNGIEELFIGIPRGAVIKPAPSAYGKPAVFYGTSIVHGGCASRPGMAYPSILGRRLNIPTINLGFSGNGRAEPEVARLVAEIDASVFVVDPLPNMTEELVKERMVPFVRILRERHPETPIVLVENITYQQSWLGAGRVNARTAKNDALETVMAPLRAQDEHLFYICGDDLLGDDGEATVDGTHPTDVGFLRMADHIEPVLRRCLSR
ncbi:MAG: SGNH/GDSL hydrolase family protein [Spirochaetes bacterium]|nr:SGNH/GDSL hydrolase family protein [Spirochaetota bacterium]